MDDFRTQLRDLIDSMRADGVNPVFLLVDMPGAEDIRRTMGAESMDRFKDSAIAILTSATDGAEAFTYGDERLVAILGDRWDRLKTFALIQKLSRTIPLLGQSFDCHLAPSFDVLEYDEKTGISGLIAELATRRHHEEDVA
jgi:hypothetical protein